jgi:predicted phosphodiesterase
MTPKQQAITELFSSFPTASNHSLARMAYKKWPELFSSAQNARERIQTYRTGRKRPGYSEKKILPTNINTCDVWGSIPEGKTEFVQWEAVNLNVKRPLILSDIHIPFHSKQPLVAALDYGKANNADSIILNGDTHDFFSVSFWEKDPRKRKFAVELKTGREFLATLRAQFGKKTRIIFKLGNHEERWERFMRVRAPELLGVEDFEMTKLLRLDDLGIEVISDKRPMRVGDLNVIHGHEYRFAIGNPVNPARGLFLRCKAYAMCGHFHQSSYHQDKTIEQKVIATWSTGCLCDFHPEYMPLNNWCHGFAFVEVSDGGKFNVQNKIVRHGKIY